MALSIGGSPLLPCLTQQWWSLWTWPLGSIGSFASVTLWFSLLLSGLKPQELNIPNIPFLGVDLGLLRALLKPDAISVLGHRR